MKCQRKLTGFDVFGLVLLEFIGVQSLGMVKDRSSRVFEFYIFAGSRINLVGFNALLQGQFKDNPHDLSPGQIKNIVHENTIGLGLGFSARKRHVLLGFCTSRSSEHYLSTQRSHYWCGVNYSYGY